ncbi:MAG: regulatory protein RecX [Myxococcaceae bacterium]
MDETERQPPKKVRKQPRKVSPRSLENAALHYLKRYASTVSRLRAVLVRRVDRSIRMHGGDRAEALEWVDALIQKLLRSGLIDDQAYARMKAQSLRSSGRSARMIALKLRMKGVPEDLLAQHLAEATAEISEEDAARTWARKKRMGPYRATEEARRENRQRDLASLARAGFSFDTAKKIIDAK